MIASAVLFAAFFVSAESITKNWVGPTNNFNSPQNWLSGQVPCSADNVTFQSTWTPTTVYVQNDVTVRNLIFPMDGVLIFDKPLTLTLDPDDTTCTASGQTTSRPGTTAVYKGQEPGDWDNPKNWKTLRSTGAPVDTSTLATTERLPCEADSVVFPAKEAISVRLNHPIKLSSMQVDGETLTQASLGQFLETSSGRGQFRLPSPDSITITGQTCSQTVCPCGNYGSDVVRTACSFADTCSAVRNCRQPVMLAGDCCAYCGVLINITVDGTFSRSVFEQKLKLQVQNQPYKTRVVSNTLVQTIIFGTGAEASANKLVSDMREAYTVYTLPASPKVNTQKSIPVVTESPPTNWPPLTDADSGQIITNKEGKPLPDVPCVDGNSPGVSGSTGKDSSSDNTPWFVVAAVCVILLIIIIVFAVYFVTRSRVEKKVKNDTKVHFVHHGAPMGTGSTTDIDGGFAAISGDFGTSGMANPLYSTVGGDDMPTELPQ